MALAVGSVSLVLHLPGAERVACVVACHGLGASKDSDKYLRLGEECVRVGWALARFDFRCSGESEGNAPASLVKLAASVAFEDTGLGAPPQPRCRVDERHTVFFKRDRADVRVSPA